MNYDRRCIALLNFSCESIGVMGTGTREINQEAAGVIEERVSAKLDRYSDIFSWRKRHIFS